MISGRNRHLLTVSCLIGQGLFAMTDTDAVFILAGGFDARRISSRLKGYVLSVEKGLSHQTFHVLDCHDQSIRASGRVLFQISDELKLVGDGMVLAQKGRAEGCFLSDLTAGPVRDALGDFPKLRAFMRIGSGVMSTQDLSVLDDLQKTQVRGVLTTLTSERGQACILTFGRMKGYDRTFKLLRNNIDLDVNVGLKTLCVTLFPDAVPYRAKPEIRLGKTEPSVEVATDLIHTFLTVARQNEAGLLANIDTEFLHDYRVSLRRVRSVLSLFKGVFSERQTIKLKRTFSDLMAPTGRVRDLDVYLLEKYNYFKLLPPSLHEGAGIMFTMLEDERKQVQAALCRRLRSAKYNKHVSATLKLFSDASNFELGPNAQLGAYDYACALIWKRYRKVCKRARMITGETPDALVHDLRIDCKKLRYLMEFFGPLFDQIAFKRILKPLKKLQDNLGFFNDAAVQQEALIDFIQQRTNTQHRADAQLAMAVGGLIAVLDQRQKVERARVIANFQNFDSPQVRNTFRSLFHQKED